MNTLTIDAATKYNLIQSDKPMPIAYDIQTSSKVIDVLESARKQGKRIRIYLGDIQTGRCWNEEHDVTGYVGLSKGYAAYFPILVHNKASFGGGGLMSNCIVKIKESKGGRVLYQADNFKQSVFEVKQADEQAQILGFTHSLHIDGAVYSNHRAEKQAIALMKKLS